MKKKSIFILVSFAIIAMIINVAFSIAFRGENGANIFTTVSGWVSGVATIILGVIALYVDKEYKKENDEFLNKQDELLWKNEKKASIELYREQVMKCYNDFSAYHYIDILGNLVTEWAKEEAPIYKVAMLSKLQSEKHKVLYELFLCRYYIDYKKELFVSYSKYLSLLEKMTTEYKEEIIKERKYDIITELQTTYAEVLKNFHMHIGEINLFLSVTMYSKTKDELTPILNNMRIKEGELFEELKLQK